jgi:hypothetical protein
MQLFCSTGIAAKKERTQEIHRGEHRGERREEVKNNEKAKKSSAYSAIPAVRLVLQPTEVVGSSIFR